jgi:hypothetical protein
VPCGAVPEPSDRIGQPKRIEPTTVNHIRLNRRGHCRPNRPVSAQASRLRLFLGLARPGRRAPGNALGHSIEPQTALLVAREIAGVDESVAERRRQVRAEHAPRQCKRVGREILQGGEIADETSQPARRHLFAGECGANRQLVGQAEIANRGRSMIDRRAAGRLRCAWPSRIQAPTTSSTCARSASSPHR